jgi:membrane-associated PAP2 superfamily phosphatase
MQRVINMAKLLQMLLIKPTLRANKGEIFYLKQIVGLLLSAYFLLFVYPKMGLDQTLIAPYFDITTQSFPLKHQIFLEQFMHTGLKYCMVFVATASLMAGLQANIYKAYRASYFTRIKLLFKNPYFLAFIGMVISTSMVSYLKSFNMHGCPNDLTLYGGKLPLLALLEQLPKGVQAGHCFPGGHASGGFALMAFYFAFHEQKPEFASVMLALALVLGFSMGWAQMMRGEHFLSHNLWTAWLVWLVLFVLFTLKKLIEKNK